MIEAIPEYRTPHTRLWWSSLGEWLDAACELGRATIQRVELDALPTGLIVTCDRREDLAALVDYLLSKRPPRGWRAHAPTTPLIVAAKNRIAQLDRTDDWALMLDGHNAEAGHG